MNATTRTVLLLILALLIGAAGGCLLAPRDDANGAAPKAKPPPVFVNPASETAEGDVIVFDQEGTRERWEVTNSGRANYEVVSTNEINPASGQASDDKKRYRFHRSQIGGHPFLIVHSLQYDPIEVANRRWESWRVEVTDVRLGIPMTYWVTNELPVNGWVRRRYTAQGHTYTMDVVDWELADR